MTLEEIEAELDKLNKKLYELIRYMTNAHVSYSEDFKYTESKLNGMKQNNPKGYNALMEYKELCKKEKELLARKKELKQQS